MEGSIVMLALGNPILGESDTTTHYIGIGDIIMHISSPDGDRPDQFANGDKVLVLPKTIEQDLQLDIDTDNIAGRLQTTLTQSATPINSAVPDCRVILDESFLQANKDHLRIIGSYFHYANNENGELVRGIREISLADIDRMILPRPASPSAKKELWIYRN